MVLKWIAEIGTSVDYVYDFGDDWAHRVTLLGISAGTPGQRYPKCRDGARACPPEDVGGPHGYEEFLKAIRNRRHPEHKVCLQWVGGSFDPEAFDPRRVKFISARRRLRDMLQSDAV